MLIDKDAAIAAIKRLEIDGPQMIWSSDAIDAVKGVEPDAPNFPDLDRVINKLRVIRTWASCRVLTQGDCSRVTETLDEALKVFDDALALITAQRRTLDEIDRYVRELDKAVNVDG
jgi:hypothetical protein